MKTALILSRLTFVSCSSTNYGDASATETVNADWGSTDLQTFATEMSESLGAATQLAFLDHPGKDGDKRIIVYMGGFDNLTGEHLSLIHI